MRAARARTLARLDVHGRDRLAVDLGGVEDARVRREGEAAHEAGVLHGVHAAALLGRRQGEGATGEELAAPATRSRGSSCRRPLTKRGASRRGARRCPARRGRAPSSGDLLPLEVHDAQAGLRPAVVGDHEVAPVGVKGHGEREIAGVQVPARGGDAPAVGEERHALALRAGARLGFRGGLDRNRGPEQERGARRGRRRGRGDGLSRGLSRIDRVRHDTTARTRSRRQYTNSRMS